MVDFLGFKANYTGPNVSDGKLQASVAFGDAFPVDQWDAFSRLHDSAFAHFTDYGHRTAANSIYNDWMKQNPSVSKDIAGWLVLYGNQIGSSLGNLGFNMTSMIVGGVKNGLNLADYAMNERRYKQEVLDYFKTDPKLGDSRYDPLNWGNGNYVPLSKVNPFGVGGVNETGNHSGAVQHAAGNSFGKPPNPPPTSESNPFKGPMVTQDGMRWARDSLFGNRVVYDPRTRRHRWKRKRIYLGK
jgi:hypothetical protein